MVFLSTFGSPDRGELALVTLRSEKAEVELIPLGAAIRSIRVPDREGRLLDVCLGYDDPRQYRELDACLGGTVGRYANRIAGALVTLGGRDWPLTANEGKNTLHGGAEGFHRKLWEYVCGENSVTFSLTSPHGEEGFPGELLVEVTYALAGDRLTVSYEARSDADTVVSLTNHAYFNLAGHQSGPMDGHELTLRADSYTPFGPGNLPTGEIRSVEGTSLDFRRPTVMDGQVLDHNFVLGERPQVCLYSPKSGIGLELSTSLPGLQLYTADFLSPRRGKGGLSYGPRHGICMEPQFFPDAPHHPSFPSPLLKAGEVYRQEIAYRFFTR